MQTELSHESLTTLDVAPSSHVNRYDVSEESWSPKAESPNPPDLIDTCPENVDTQSETLSDHLSDRSERSYFSAQDADDSAGSISTQPTTAGFSDDEKEALLSDSPPPTNPRLSPRSRPSYAPSLQGIGRTVLGVAVDSSVTIASRFLPQFVMRHAPTTMSIDQPNNETNLSALSELPHQGENGDQMTTTDMGGASSQLDSFLERIQSMNDMIRGRVQILQSRDSADALLESTGDTEWARDVNDRQNVRQEIDGLISQTMNIRHMFPNFSNRFSDSDARSGGEGGEGMFSSLLNGSAAMFEHVSHELFPFFQEFVVETWDFLREVLEYYDPDPKYNVFLRTIEKVNEVIAAIQALCALSECYFNELESLDGHRETFVCGIPPPGHLMTTPPPQVVDDNEEIVGEERGGSVDIDVDVDVENDDSGDQELEIEFGPPNYNGSSSSKEEKMNDDGDYLTHVTTRLTNDDFCVSNDEDDSEHGDGHG